MNTVKKQFADYYCDTYHMIKERILSSHVLQSTPPPLRAALIREPRPLCVFPVSLCARVSHRTVHCVFFFG